MITKIAIQHKKIKQTKKNNRLNQQLGGQEAWRAVQGIWKSHKIDPLNYQRRIRKEADHIHPL